MSSKQIIHSVVAAGFILSLPLVAQGLLDNLHIHGFVSQGYLKSTGNNYLTSDSKDGSMDYSEATINFLTSPAANFNIGTQLYARDMDLDGNLVVTIDWAYGDYHWKDFMGVRVGRFKNPLGLYSKVRDVDMARVPIFLPQGIYGEAERDMNLAINGVGLYGNIPASAAGDFDYEVVYGGYNLLDQKSTFFTNQYLLTGEGVASGMVLDPSVQSAALAGTSDEESKISNVVGE
ncbi:hypothetical protein JW948_02545 [bacterium]|nr:hypothetical protein [bacterium]